MYKAKEKKTNI